MDKNTFIHRFADDISKGNAAVFGGAGMSVPSGTKDWKSLMKPLADELGIELTDSTDLTRLAQFYVNKKGGNRTRVSELILNEFNDISINEYHSILSCLPICTYWTTNYDHAIEDSLKKTGKKVAVKCNPQSLATSLIGCDAVVYKMHGDKDDAENCVLTEDDYDFYSVKRNGFLPILKNDLTTKTFLFLGFSFEDPNLHRIFANIRLLLHNHCRTHYCIMLKEVEKSKVKKQELFCENLLRYGIETIYVNKWGEIPEILKEIQKVYNRKSIYISGASHEYGTYTREEYEKFISDLSETLVRNGYRIISGYGLGVGSAVISGVLNEVYGHQHKSLTNELLLRPFPQGDDDIKALWSQYRRDMIRNSGISLFILGNKLDINTGKLLLSNGMQEEYDLSKEQGNFLLPIAATGYMAESLYEQLIKNLDEEHKKYEAELRVLSDKSLSLNELREQIVSLIKKCSQCI